ncbi:MAG: hypothetical protein J2P18_08990, partial [Nocardia sp.]|nr:hypothetical protein [Nocardia sp.]
MHTIGSGPDSGVIAPPPSAGTPSAPAAPAAPAPAMSAPAAQQGPISDVPMPQLPPDTQPAQQPAFTTGPREHENHGSHPMAAPHLPGTGGPAPD